jgi:hypothetical protein
MAQSKPAGPRSVWGAAFAVGVLLSCWALWWHPSIHSCWQAPLGLYLAVVGLGKVASR